MGLNGEFTLPWLCADQHFRERFIKGLREIKEEKFDKHSSFFRRATKLCKLMRQCTTITGGNKKCGPSQDKKHCSSYM